MGLWVAIVAPVVVLWLLLLFAPASSRLAIGERVAVGIVGTAIIVPMIWFR
ncbi:MAG: hypothetical protein ACRD0V_13645 [Acidimicrobiales bacterium]